MIRIGKILLCCVFISILVFPSSIIFIPFNPANAQTASIPSWIKNNAKWWADGQIGDDEFTKAIQYLVQQKIIVIPETQVNSNSTNEIPSWIKNNAKWWADGQIGDSDFVKGIQYLVQNDIISIQITNSNTIIGNIGMKASQATCTGPTCATTTEQGMGQKSDQAGCTGPTCAAPQGTDPCLNQNGANVNTDQALAFASCKIDQKYKYLISKGYSGNPSSDITRTADGKGFYRTYSNGQWAIYYTGKTGAHDIHGVLYAKWKQLGGESSFGYPILDDSDLGSGGRYINLINGVICYTTSDGSYARLYMAGPNACTEVPAAYAGIIPDMPSDLVVKLHNLRGIDLGSPISPDKSIQGFTHFILFQAPNNPNVNSIEVEKNTDGSTCAYIAYTPTKSPYWYDNFDAEESDYRELFTAHREWAGDVRTLGQVMDSNWNPSTWGSNIDASTYAPFPHGRASPPQWLHLCVSNGGTLSGLNTAADYISDSAKYCNYWEASVLGSHLEWAMIDPPLDFTMQLTTKGFPSYPNLKASEHIPWNPHTASGVITQTVRAGDDNAQGHANPDDVAPNYWLGNFPLWYVTDPCATLHANHDLCNDWQNGMWVDPEYRGLIDGGGGYNQNLWTEVEQWLAPQGYRPDPGDRAYLTGRWITDCGHAPDHTELHPIEAMVSTFMQTGALTRFEPQSRLHPTMNENAQPFLEPTIDNYNGLTMGNVPNISSGWSQFTNGRPATVTKFVITGDWEGEDLSYDIYPPVRPSADAVLHWEKESMEIGNGVSLSVNPVPPANPNHLVVTVTDNPKPKPLWINDEFGQVFPDPNRRVVDAFMLWWKYSDSTTGSNPAPNPSPGIYPCTNTNLVTKINSKYNQLNWGGAPVTSSPQASNDNLGCFQSWTTNWKNYSIYVGNNTPAQEIGGSILDKWSSMNYGAGPLGYPITDETTVQGMSSAWYSSFEHGLICSGNGKTVVLMGSNELPRYCLDALH